MAQDATNKVELHIKELPTELTQDKFAGAYLFPALLRLLKGSGYVFDKELPISLYFESEEYSLSLITSAHIKSRSASAIRKVCLIFCEALAALAMPTTGKTIYQLVDMKGERGREFRDYARGLMRPSVSLDKALAAIDNESEN